MRAAPWLAAEPYRNRNLPGHHYGDDFGAFIVPSPVDRGELRVMVGNGEGWEHVSVSRANRCPNWPEMNFIKDLFWSEEECVMQLHPPKSSYVNVHPHCLHLWRPKAAVIPQPPTWMV